MSEHNGATSSNDDSAERDSDRPARWFLNYSASSVGIEIVVAIVLPLWFFNWLERTVTHFAPWTTMFGLFVGLGAAFKAVLRTIRQHDREVARRKSRATKAHDVD